MSNEQKHDSSQVGFFELIWRRRLVQFAVLYLGVAWGVLQVVAFIEQTLELPDWVDRTTLVIVAVGFPVALIIAWFHYRRLPGGDGSGSSAQTQAGADARAPRLDELPRPASSPSVAVLPFVNLSDETEKEYFADGMTEDIITGLSRLRHVAVTSRTSTFSYKGKSPDVREIASEFGVRYVVEGSVRPVGGRLRINVQLIDAGSGNHLWAEKYDAELSELFDVQDDIIDRITARIGAQLTSAEFERTRQLRPEALSSWEAVQKALATFSSDALSPALLPQIIADLRAAAQRDPDYAYVHSVLAWMLFSVATSGYSEDWAADFEEAGEHLAKGLRLAKDDPLNLMYCGAAASHGGKQRQAVELLNRSLEGNPLCADALLYLGVAHGYLGEFDEAYAAIDRAEAMAPSGGFAVAHSYFRGKVLFLEGRHEQAIERLAPYIRSQPEHSAALVFYALSQAMAGREDKADRTLRRALVAKPDLTFDQIAMFVTAHPDREESARRLAVLQNIWPTASP